MSSLRKRAHNERGSNPKRSRQKTDLLQRRDNQDNRSILDIAMPRLWTYRMEPYFYGLLPRMRIGSRSIYKSRCKKPVLLGERAGKSANMLFK